MYLSTGPKTIYQVLMYLSTGPKTIYQVLMYSSEILASATFLANCILPKCFPISAACRDFPQNTLVLSFLFGKIYFLFLQQTYCSWGIWNKPQKKKNRKLKKKIIFLQQTYCGWGIWNKPQKKKNWKLKKKIICLQQTYCGRGYEMSQPVMNGGYYYSPSGTPYTYQVQLLREKTFSKLLLFTISIRMGLQCSPPRPASKHSASFNSFLAR